MGSPNAPGIKESNSVCAELAFAPSKTAFVLCAAGPNSCKGWAPSSRILREKGDPLSEEIS